MSGTQETIIHAIWATAATIVICVLLGAWINGTNANHNFDTTCINKGKTIVYNTKLGDESAYKECK